MILVIKSSLLIQVVSVLIAALTFIVAKLIEKQRDKKIANREVYLRLEFASIDLFRFEAANMDIISPIWDKNAAIPEKGTAAYKVTMNYLCQLLNLFELAIKFRKDGTMPKDIFGSWVSWFFELNTAPGFPKVWGDVKWDYVSDLRNIFDQGLKVINEADSEYVAEERFYQYVAQMFHCKIIANWLDSDIETELDQHLKNKQYNVSKTNKVNWENFTIRWIHQSDMLNDLVSLFIENSKENYISHSEMMEGRAVSETEWSLKINNILMKEFEEATKNPPFEKANIIGAFYNDQLIGFLFIEYGRNEESSYAIFSDILVNKNFRNLGVGKKLISWASKKLNEKEFRSIYAESNIRNHSTHEFLKKIGFKNISKVFKKDI